MYNVPSSRGRRQPWSSPRGRWHPVLLELIDGVDLARRNILCEILNRRCVLHEIVHNRSCGFAETARKGPATDLLPLRIQVPINRRAATPVRHAFAGVAGDHKHTLAPRIAAKETSVVDGFHYLPDQRWVSAPRLGTRALDPGRQSGEPPFSIVSRTRFVVLAASRRKSARALTGLQADIVIRIFHVPVEPNPETAPRSISNDIA